VTVYQAVQRFTHNPYGTFSISGGSWQTLAKDDTVRWKHVQSGRLYLADGLYNVNGRSFDPDSGQWQSISASEIMGKARSAYMDQLHSQHWWPCEHRLISVTPTSSIRVDDWR
jgi:hypothetical protein